MKNMKLIIESWRSHVSEDREETQEYDNQKYALIAQVRRDLVEIGMDWIWDDMGVEDDITELSWKNNNIPELIKSIKIYFSNEEAQQNKWGYPGLQDEILTDMS